MFWNMAWLRLFGCAPQSAPLQADETSVENHDREQDSAIDIEDVNDTAELLPHTEDLSLQFSSHFQQWLAEHPEYSSDLTRLDIEGGSFGGFEGERYPLEHKPIVFIHGNGDRASGGVYGGWSSMRQHFLDAGFNNAELYATTYGPADSLYLSEYRHDVDSLQHIRHFLEAVIAYTGADKIDVISYSLGVTLTRKAILGGGFTDANQRSVQLGEPLSRYIDTFVGIAGANQGLTSCYAGLTPACSSVDGLYPGTNWGFGVTGQSRLLQSINQHSGYEGDYRYSIWSQADEVLGFGCIVWGTNTARLPDQTGEKSYLLSHHLDLKENTFDVLYAMTQEHRIP